MIGTHELNVGDEDMLLNSAPVGKKYARTIEGMGEGLVLFRVSASDKRIGQNYHFFFEDGRKPPLDIAINPDVGIIEYISYFAQDEKIETHKIANSIVFKKEVPINLDVFKKGHVNFSLNRRFKIVKSDRDIFILSSMESNMIFQTFEIDRLNYLLFTENMELQGVSLKNISKNEFEEIQNSKCI